MGALTDVGVRIQFATTRFCETVDVHPEDDQHHHQTLHLPPHVGEGRVDLTNLGRGLALVWGHCVPRGEALRCRIDPNAEVTQLVFHRSGSAARVVLNGRTRGRLFRRHELMVLPPSVTGTVVLEPDVRTEQVAILITSEELAQLDTEQLESETLSSLLVPTSRSKRAGGGARLVAANSALDVAVSQLLSCPLHGSLARFYLEAKTLEVIALSVDHLRSDAAQTRAVALNKRDIELLEEARAHLLQTFRDPPTIAELAHRVGLNRTKLKAGFRKRFHSTIFGFVREQRMHKAMTLLQDGSYNVTEVAHLVGYASLSAFAVAFKATHGFCPCAVRGIPAAGDPPGWCGCEE